MKKCKDCGNIKKLSEFYKNNYSADRLSYSCKECDLKKIKKYRDKNPDKIKKTNAESYKKYREKRINEARIYAKNNPEVHKRAKAKLLLKDPLYSKRNDLKRKYGLTLEEYTTMLNNQDNKCSICGNEFSKTGSKSSFVDHNHETNQVRDILCHFCNTALGLMRENPEYIRNMIKYLNKWEK